jgi:hypothetical protein
MPVLSACNWLMAALFGLSAVLQYNDPDPLSWIALYAAAAAACVLWGLRRATWPLAVRDDVRPVRLERKHLHRDALGFEHLYQVVGGGLLVARRARRVHAHERLEVPQRLGLDAGRPALRLRARTGGRETEQQCEGDPYFDRHGSFRQSACARHALRYRERRAGRQRYPRT